MPVGAPTTKHHNQWVDGALALPAYNIASQKSVEHVVVAPIVDLCMDTITWQAGVGARKDHCFLLTRATKRRKPNATCMDDIVPSLDKKTICLDDYVEQD